MIQIDPAADGTLKIDGLSYHGRLRLVPRGQERFDLINDLGVENYLKGVLAREMLKQWDVQTYEAQAVVARTYAIYETKSASPTADFDVFADQRSQMYGGIAAESDKAKAAVEATSGTVVVAGPPGQEHIFKAYFCSCCGGIGQSAADAFGDVPSPELAEQSSGSLCCAAPFYSWGPIDISKAELTRRFRRFALLHNRPDAASVTIAKIDIFADNTLGRPVRFIATATDGQRIFLSGEELRWAVNTDAHRHHPAQKLAGQDRQPAQDDPLHRSRVRPRRRHVPMDGPKARRDGGPVRPDRDAGVSDVEAGESLLAAGSTHDCHPDQ